MKIIRDLVLSLINATLMLAIILVVCGLLLVGRISDLREETEAMVTKAVAPQAERLDRLAQGIEAIESRMDNGGPVEMTEIRSMISELRDDLPARSEMRCIARQTLIMQITGRIRRALNFEPGRN